jgi:hypothetical protein
MIASGSLPTPSPPTPGRAGLAVPFRVGGLADDADAARSAAMSVRISRSTRRFDRRHRGRAPAEVRTTASRRWDL